MTSGQIVGYRRVSSSSQSLVRQELPEVTGRIFEEKLTGAKRERPALQEMLAYIRDGDEVHVHSIDRLARNLKDLEGIVGEIIGKSASIRFIKEGLHFKPDQETDPFQKLMFQMLGSFAEFERSISKARQAEGIKKAKEEGKYLGRKPQINPYIVHYLFRYISAEKIAELMGIGRASVFRIKKEQYLFGDLGDELLMDAQKQHIIDDYALTNKPLTMVYICYMIKALELGFEKEEIFNKDGANTYEGIDQRKKDLWFLFNVLMQEQHIKWCKDRLEEHPTLQELKEFLVHLEDSHQQAMELLYIKSPLNWRNEYIDTDAQLEWMFENGYSASDIASRTGERKLFVEALIKEKQANPTEDFQSIAKRLDQ